MGSPSETRWVRGGSVVELRRRADPPRKPGFPFAGARADWDNRTVHRDGRKGASQGWAERALRLGGGGGGAPAARASEDGRAAWQPCPPPPPPTPPDTFRALFFSAGTDRDVLAGTGVGVACHVLLRATRAPTCPECCSGWPAKR